MTGKGHATGSRVLSGEWDLAPDGKRKGAVFLISREARVGASVGVTASERARRHYGKNLRLPRPRGGGRALRKRRALPAPPTANDGGSALAVKGLADGI